MTKNLQKNIENMGEEILHTDVVKRIKYNNEIYLVNESKGLTIREMRTPLILSNMNIPIYTGNVVHFKDVFQQIVKNAFDYTGEPYLPDVKLQAKLKKKWTKQIKRKDITLDMADEYMAGKMIFNRYKFLRHNRIKKRSASSSVHFHDLYADGSLSDEESYNEDKFNDSISGDPSQSIIPPIATVEHLKNEYQDSVRSSISRAKLPPVSVPKSQFAVHRSKMVEISKVQRQ